MGRNAAIAKSREVLDRAVSAAGYDSVSLPPGIDPMRLPQDRPARLVDIAAAGDSPWQLPLQQNHHHISSIFGQQPMHEKPGRKPDIPTPKKYDNNQLH